MSALVTRLYHSRVLSLLHVRALMAVFDITDAAEIGFRISSPNAKGVLSIIGGDGELTLLANDPEGATFKIDNNSRADKVFISYDDEGGRIRLKDVVFVNEKPEDVVAVYNLDLLTNARSITEAARTAHLNKGRDEFFGSDFDDVIEGGLEADYIASFGGRDKLAGGGGNDTLSGGLGKDRLSGGDGKDTFVFTDPAESTAGRQRDVIEGFKHRRDTIDLSAIDTRSDARGDQPFGWIDEEEFSGHAGQLRFSGKVLQADLDGDAKADFEVRVTGTLSPIDFIF